MTTHSAVNYALIITAAVQVDDADHHLDEAAVALSKANDIQNSEREKIVVRLRSIKEQLYRLQLDIKAL